MDLLAGNSGHNNSWSAAADLKLIESGFSLKGLSREVKKIKPGKRQIVLVGNNYGTVDFFRLI